eukprot:XP_001700617.1 predicted protein [Chlamydomonas reinhardtii]
MSQALSSSVPASEHRHMPGGGAQRFGMFKVPSLVFDIELEDNGIGGGWCQEEEWEEDEIVSEIQRFVQPSTPAEARLAADVYVGPEEHLALLVQFLCAEMAAAFRQLGSVLPPWRQAASMLSKRVAKERRRSGMRNSTAVHDADVAVPRQQQQQLKGVGGQACAWADGQRGMGLRGHLSTWEVGRPSLLGSADAGASPAQLLSPSRRAARPIVASALRHLQARRDAAAATALASAAAGSPSSPSLSGSLPGQRSGAGGSPGGGKENEGAAAAAVGGKGQDLSKAPCSAPSAAPPPQSTPLRARGVAGGLRSPFGRGRAAPHGPVPALPVQVHVPACLRPPAAAHEGVAEMRRMVLREAVEWHALLPDLIPAPEAPEADYLRFRSVAFSNSAELSAVEAFLAKPAVLARSWPVVAALLATKPRVHRGCYKLAGLGQIHFEPQPGAKNRPTDHSAGDHATH